MGVFSNLRRQRQQQQQQQQQQDNQSSNDVVSSSSPMKRKCVSSSSLLPLFIILVVVAEIAFLGRLDMSKNAALVDSFFSDSLFFWPSSSSSSSKDVVDPSTVDHDVGFGGILNDDDDKDGNLGSCEEWLEKKDFVAYSRDFEISPIWVSGNEQEWKTCAVGCKFGVSPNKNPDAVFGFPEGGGVASVLRSMESAQYYAENNIDQARRRGFEVVMTTSLSSDVPVGYFSWAEYDIMAPVQPKTEKALAAAFISNCGARNFRLQALEGLENANIKIDSYGSCHRNRDGNVQKVEALKHYKFSLAFENSNEEDYVTEKFFQSLVAGTIPVVVGAPNIQEFAPAPGSILHIKEIQDIKPVAETIKNLANNPEAYNQSLRWKYEGPSDSFKALVDMAAVHSSCRLCIHLATKIREKEEATPAFKKRPCKCTRGSETMYHLYVRERGKFEMESIFLRSNRLTLEALESAVVEKFKSLNHVPVWKQERPESLQGGNELKIYRIYPVGMTQRQALYTFSFNGDNDLKSHIERNPCGKFEVIFV